MFVKRAHRAPMSFGAIALLFVSAAWAVDESLESNRVSIQPRARAVSRNDVSIRVDSNLVLIPVSVTDPKNHPVTGLTSNHFRIFEGKAEQKVLRLSSEDVPVSIGIVFDASGSMAGKIAKAREAVAEFLKTANPEDEFFLVDFNSAIDLAVPFTTNTDEIQARLNQVECKGKTALLDAMYMALQYMRKAKNQRKALLVISDGGDNHSRFTARETRNMVREAGAWIYALGVYAHGSQTLPEEERGGEKLLSDIAEETGGRQFALHNASELPGAAATIGLQLRNQYILAYSPANTEEDGKYRRVQVKLVEGRDMNLSWRSGYYAPAK